ncbi:hypothetical protein V1523DRAFT_325274, partial [Lipomyces doorenjongii]
DVKIFISILAVLSGVLGVTNYDPSVIVLPTDNIVALHYNEIVWMEQYLANLTALSYYLRSHGIDHGLISYVTLMPNT